MSFEFFRRECLVRAGNINRGNDFPAGIANWRSDRLSAGVY